MPPIPCRGGACPARRQPRHGFRRPATPDRNFAPQTSPGSTRAPHRAANGLPALQCDAKMYHMKKASIRDLRYRFSKVEDLLREGEEIHITKRKRVVARLLPPEPATPKAFPDFLGRAKNIFGNKALKVSGAELIRQRARRTLLSCYADASFLFSLYALDAHSVRAQEAPGKLQSAARSFGSRSTRIHQCPSSRSSS